MFNIHGPCDIIHHIHPTAGYRTRKEKKNAEKSPNIFIIIHLPGRRQIIGKILHKKRDRERERERESAY